MFLYDSQYERIQIDHQFAKMKMNGFFAILSHVYMT